MGFAAEIKEFLGAAKDSWKLMSDTELKEAQAKYTNVKAQAEQKEMDDPLNQQLKEAKLAHAKASTANIGRETPLQALQRRALQMQIDAAQNPPQGAAGVAAPPVTRPAVGAPAREDPNAIEGSGYKSGGLVRKFAVGGVVDDEDLEDEVTPQVTPAVGGMSGATDFSAQRRGASAIPLPRARPPNPVDDGLKYGATQIAQLPAIGPARTRGVQGYARGAGGAPPDDMIQVYRKIDPKGEMGESERNLYALEAVHRFKMNQGDTEGAARAAFQMLQTYKTAATRYAALSKAAMDGGNVDEGMKLAMKAYAQVPDGNDMKLYKGKDGRIGYELTDKDGKKVTGGIATPEEIGSAAMKLATPGGFENHLVQMAGGAKIGGKTVGGGAGKKEDEEAGPGVPKAAEYKGTQEDVGKHVDAMVEKLKADPKNKGKEITDTEIASMKNAVYHIRRNNDVTDDEAFKAAQSFITAPEAAKKGERAPFKVIKDKEAGTAKINYPDGRTLELPMTDYLPLAAARGQALADAEKRAKEPKTKTTGEYLGEAGTAGLDIAKDAGRAIGAVGEAAAGQAGRIAAPVGEVLKGSVPAEAGAMAIEALKRNRPDIPYNEEDRPL